MDDLLKTADHTLNNDQALRALVKAEKVEIHTGTKVIAIKEDGIEIEKDGKKTKIPCTEVVLACGYKSNNELANKLVGKIEFRVIGDSAAPRKIICAVHEGFHASRVL